MFGKLGFTTPIIQAPMAGVSTPELTAVVANAGGLGFVALGSCDARQAAEVLAQTRAMTVRPFGVNFFCHSPVPRDAQSEARWLDVLRPEFERFDARPPVALAEIYPSFVMNDDLLAVVKDAKPSVISFHFGLPRPDQIAALREIGAIMLATATSLDEGRKIVATGLDGIVAQGWQAGGHRGVFDPVEPDRDEQLSTLDLLARLRGLGIPLIAAGGIMTAADRREVMEAGAVGVQCGTAFLLAPEAGTSPLHRERLGKAATRMTRAISGRPARGLLHPLMEMDEAAAPAYPMAYDAAKALAAAAADKGDHSYAAQWAGTGAAKAVARPAAETLAAISG